MNKIIYISIVLFVVSSGSLAAEKKLASAYISEGIANYNDGNYLEAILSLRAAEQLSPDLVTAYKYMGMSYSKLALWRQAVKEFNKILFISPDDPERAQIIASIHDWENETDQVPMMAKYSYYSIKYKNKIWEDPNNLLNYLSLTEIYLCSGRYEEAENFFRALVKDMPEKTVFKEYLANVLLLDNKYGEAGNYYRKILEEEPLNTDAIIGLNLILKKRYEDILTVRPSNTVTYIKLARVYREMKRLEDAISAYEKYLERDSANIEVRRELDETIKLLEAVSPGSVPR